MFEGDFALPLPLPVQVIPIDFGPDPMVGMYAGELTADMIVATGDTFAADKADAAPSSLKDLLQAMEAEPLSAGASLLDSLMLTTSSLAILPSEDPGLTTHVEFTEGEPPPEDEVVVTGTRPKKPVAEEPDVPDVGGGSGTDTPGGGGDGGDGGGGGDPEPEKDGCPDGEAMEAAEEIKKDEYEDAYSESTSLIYIAKDGSIQHTPVITSGTNSIGYDVYDAILAVNGITWSQVIGMVHNHPSNYGTTDESRDINRYPTGDLSYNDGDWGFGRYATDRGASADLSIYLIDTQGTMREFKWSNRDFYAGLTRQQKDDGVGLPGEVEGCGSS